MGRAGAAPVPEYPPLAAAVDSGDGHELFGDGGREENVGKIDPEGEETKEGPPTEPC